MFRHTFLAVSALVLAHVAPAFGQMQAPAIPVAIDLNKAPIGSWSEFTMTSGKAAPMKQRHALVGQDAAGFLLEMSMEGGPLAAAGKAVIQATLGNDLTKPDRLKKVVMQLGNNDPMEMPVSMGGLPKDQFGKVDPKKYVDTQTVTTPGGTFKAKHYRDKTPQGDVYDYWLSEDVPPIGLVKLQGKMKNGPGGVPADLRIELVARGKGAKPTITKTAKPFDPAALMGQMGGGARAR